MGSLYVMAGGAAAVLTGLVVVAVTLHVRPIIGNVLHRDRAWSSVAILASQLIIAWPCLCPPSRCGSSVSRSS
jgi:hypothetical protein